MKLCLPIVLILFGTLATAFPTGSSGDVTRSLLSQGEGMSRPRRVDENYQSFSERSCSENENQNQNALYNRPSQYYPPDMDPDELLMILLYGEGNEKEVTFLESFPIMYLVSLFLQVRDDVRDQASSSPTVWRKRQARVPYIVFRAAVDPENYPSVSLASSHQGIVGRLCTGCQKKIERIKGRFRRQGNAY
jgi:hypothetical protein